MKFTKLIVGVAFALSALIGAASATSVTPTKTHEIMEWVYLNIHTDFGGTSPWASASWRQKFIDLGFRYARTGVNFNTPGHAAALYQSGGVKLIVPVLRQIPSGACVPGNAAVDSELDDIKTYAGPYVYALEGTNEYDRFCSGASWPTDLRNIQAEIWNYARSVAYGFAGPIFGPSTWQNSNDQLKLLAATDIKLYMNQAVGHFYSDRRQPSIARRIDNGVTTFVDISQSFIDAQAVHPGKGVQESETGYQTPLRITSASAQSKYNGRSLAESYKLRVDNANLSEGWGLYALMDNTATGDFGLIDQSYQPKPSYYTVRNILGKLNDGTWDGVTWTYRKNFTPYAIDMSYTNPGNIKSVALQKKDGRTYVLFWNDVSSVNPSTGADIANSDVTLPVSFTQTFSRLDWFDVTTLTGENGDVKRDSAVTTALNANGITIAVKDQVGILVLTP